MQVEVEDASGGGKSVMKGGEEMRDGSFQLPRVIEGGVEVNDSRQFDLRRVWHWQRWGGGMRRG